MKKLIFLTIVLFGCLTLVTAQPNNPRVKEKIEARRVAFFTNKLELTPEEAQKFWPLFNEFQEKRELIVSSNGRAKNFQIMSDEEVEQFVNRQLEEEEKLLALKKEYVQKLKSVLPIRKVAMLPRVEKRFKEWILQQIRNRRGKK